MKLKTPAKIFAILFLFTFSLNALIATPALAQIDWETDLGTVGEPGYGTVTEDTALNTVGKIIKVALGLLGIILLALLIYAGFLWMTSAGDDEKVEMAKKIINAAVIGIIIVIVAYALTWFIMSKITTEIIA